MNFLQNKILYLIKNLHENDQLSQFNARNLSNYY